MVSQSPCDGSTGLVTVEVGSGGTGSRSLAITSLCTVGEGEEDGTGSGPGWSIGGCVGGWTQYLSLASTSGKSGEILRGLDWIFSADSLAAGLESAFFSVVSGCSSLSVEICGDEAVD